MSLFEVYKSHGHLCWPGPSEKQIPIWDYIREDFIRGITFKRRNREVTLREPSGSSGKSDLNKEKRERG